MRRCKRYSVAITEFPQLHSTMNNPMLSKEAKQELLEIASGGDVSSLLKSFFALF